ncbi:unnamed protein product [marine sediment metagenome]|uniref:HTH asnC-type domain-containing protein n=1 Tax=marine sediment metagenome TaxID=412755 RepID=X1FHH4_9ZZZZ
MENAKISDTAIGNKLNISSQGVGRIRRKLEKEIIKSYSLNLDYTKLGIGIFFQGKIKLTAEGIELGKKKVEEKLMNNERFFALYELLGENFSYLFIAAFKDVHELHSFFNSNKNYENFHKYIQVTDTISIPIRGMLKNNMIPLINKLIDEQKTRKIKINFDS